MSQERIYAPTLDGFVAAVEKNRGIGLTELGSGRTLIVQTQNHTYTIQITNPNTGEVIVTGGEEFANATVCRLSGSTWGGANIKMHWVGIGMLLEFHVRDGVQVTTSMVQTISLLGAQPSQHIH